VSEVFCEITSTLHWQVDKRY